MNKCLYYQASVIIKTTNLFVATFRYYEHIAFDRTLDAQKGIFEFFVPVDQEKLFLEAMSYLERRQLVHSVIKAENRL
ncbi:MAG: hypothetical protein K2X90_02540 [Candidatus Babeliaceae bacterium]|nr:hypothetical protein [Candidatus Babeliaceae bacterium]